jgi:hypothetical protein
MNSDCSSESNNDSNLIEYFKQKKDFNFVNTDNKNLIKIITNISIPENIRFIGNIIDTQLYMWQETKHNIFLCGIKNSPIKSWYKIKSETELNILRDAFSKNDKTYIMNSRFLLYSTQVADFDTLINYIINSEFIKDTIYLDEKDETNQIPINKRTRFDNANIKTRILKSDCDEFYLYTRYSNSKLKFENHRGYFIVEMNYNQIKLRNRFEPFDKFLPVDINLILNEFELKSISDIIDKKNIIEKDIDCCVLLAKDKKNLIKLQSKLEENKEKYNYSEDIINYIELVSKRVKLDEKFIKIEEDGIFKSFENSVDILINTIYERFNTEEINDYTYINDILKYKVNTIFYSKFL